jgi:cysteine desulfurase
MDRIYLDHAATTPVDPRVVTAMLPYFTEIFGNASSVHSTGRDAKSALESARNTIARAIGAQPGEVVFTSGGTESDNAAINGVLRASPADRRDVVTSSAEHHAVLSTCEEVERAGGRVTILPVDGNGIVDRQALSTALKHRPLLVSLMYANNEIGAITPLNGIAEEVHSAGALLHTDAVQALGKVPLDVNTLGVDLMSLTAHKLYGPKGIGALYIRNGTSWDPVLHGGGQERGRRPGTENVALAVGFARAVEIAVEEMTEESARISALRDQLASRLTTELPAVVHNSTASDRLPHILNISFDNTRLPMHGEMLIVNLDLAGVAVSSGSACTSGSVKPSHVLLAMGRDAATAAASVRFSFGRASRADDVNRVVVALEEAIPRVRLN